MQFEVVAEHLAFPEEPRVMPDLDRISIVVEILAAGRVTRLWGEGRKEVVAMTGGGPNGAALGPDGAIYVCNSGAIDPELGCHLDEGPDAVGRIERIDPATGTVERLYERCGDITLGAPNDLVFDEAGGSGSRILAKFDRSREKAAFVLYPTVLHPCRVFGRRAMAASSEPSRTTGSACLRMEEPSMSPILEPRE